MDGWSVVSCRTVAHTAAQLVRLTVCFSELAPAHERNVTLLQRLSSLPCLVYPPSASAFVGEITGEIKALLLDQDTA